MFKCIYCGKPAKTKRGLGKHLSGGFQYGGHELKETELESILNNTQEYSVVTQSYINTLDITKVVKPNNEYGLFLYELFDSLIFNKNVPKYQFERRIDTILELFLPEILSQLFNGSVQFVLPEFPIKKTDNNQSTNIDYLFFLSGLNIEDAYIFVELKTDTDSIDMNQINKYVNAKNIGMHKIIDGLESIYESSKKRTKYMFLKQRLNEYPKSDNIKIVYICPQSSKLDLIKNENIIILTYNDLFEYNLKQHSETWDLFKNIILKSLINSKA